MENSDNTLLALGVLSLFPPAIRAKMRLGEEFYDRFGIERKISVRIGSSPRFDRDELYDKARLALTEGGSYALKDIDNDVAWTITSGERQATVVIRDDSEEISFQFAFAVALNADLRIDGFSTNRFLAGLPPHRKEYWLSRLQQGPLANAEIEVLSGDAARTPAAIELRLDVITSRESFGLHDLVPTDKVYYELLVGKLTESTDILSYARDEAAGLFEELLCRTHGNDYRALLLLSAHSSCVRALSDLIDARFPDAIAEIAEIVPQDLISCVGMIELFSTRAGNYGDLLARLINKLHSDVSGCADKCRLLSAMFQLTEGDIAQRGVLDGASPFWRRLASFAHASVLLRFITPEVVNVDEFERQAVERSAQFFTLRTLLDLSSEPRWTPVFASTEQLKAELVGRALIAVLPALEQADVPGDLRQAVEQLRTEFRGELSFLSWLSGPCEAGIAPQQQLPADLSAKLKDEFAASPVTRTPFERLFNMALAVNVDRDVVASAVSALRNLITTADGTVDRGWSELVPLLAHVSAVTRDRELARELRILARLSRRLSDSRLGREHEFFAAIVASAAFSDPADAAEFRGSWIREISRAKISKTEARAIQSHVQLLTYLQPALWRELGAAEAGFAAAAF